MSQYPIKHLPSHIRTAINDCLIGNGYIKELPFSLKIKGESVWTYFVTPKAHCTSFLIRVNLTTGQQSFYMGDYEGSYADREVDRDKTKRNMEKGFALVKGWLLQKDLGPALGTCNVLHPDTEVIFHPSQMIKPIPEVKIAERERKILFCFGSLKEGGLRRQALYKLNVSKPEIESLVEKGLLKKVGKGYIVTMLSEANRLPKPFRGEKSNHVDQW